MKLLDAAAAECRWFEHVPVTLLWMDVWCLDDHAAGAAAAADLYNCGKVCLSLLGTWNGGQGEGWNPDVSSAFQVRKPACSRGSSSCCCREVASQAEVAV